MEHNTSEDFLNSPEYQYVQASTGKRFANYLIDMVTFYFFLGLIGFIIGAIMPGVTPMAERSMEINFMDRILTLLIYGVFMGFTEGIGKGKTIGKLITGTRAINENGSMLSFKTAALRGLSRAVPFEAFSALGRPSYPWHDKWTNTLVIDEKLSG